MQAENQTKDVEKWLEMQRQHLVAVKRQGQKQNSGQGKVNATFFGLEDHKLKWLQFFVGGVRVVPRGAVAESARLDSDERSFTGLSFPMYLYDAALPAGSALMLLRYAIRLVRYLFYFDPATMSVGHTIIEAPTDMQPKG